MSEDELRNAHAAAKQAAQTIVRPQPPVKPSVHNAYAEVESYALRNAPGGSIFREVERTPPLLPDAKPHYFALNQSRSSSCDDVSLPDTPRTTATEVSEMNWAVEGYFDLNNNNNIKQTPLGMPQDPKNRTPVCNQDAFLHELFQPDGQNRRRPAY